MADAMKPHYTSDDLIEAVQRKISLPLSEETFTEDSILRFANEEMMLGQVPSVLIYHENYFVHPVEVALQDGVSRYAIPDRAIGMRLRDLKYKDTSDNIFDMAQIEPANKAFFQKDVGSFNNIHKFYLEGNDIVLTPEVTGDPGGSLIFYIYLRPNQLVQNERAAILESIDTTSATIKKNFQANSTYVQITPTNTITITSHGFVNGNKLTFSSSTTVPAGLTAGTTYYVVNAAANTFQVAATVGGAAISITDVGTGVHTVTRTKELDVDFDPADVDFAADTITLTNNDLADNDMVLVSSTGDLPTPLEENTIYFVLNRSINSIQLATAAGGTAINITYVGTGTHTISSDLTTLTFDEIPDNITAGDEIDFLQTEVGHKTYSYDVEIPASGLDSDAGTIVFAAADVPDGFEVGDYICLRNECMIPQIPSDLHNGLAERTCARILASMGDAAGLQTVNSKIQEINASQGTLLDARAEGAPKKIVAKNSLLRFGRR